MSHETDRFPVRQHIRLPQSVYQAGHVFFVTIGTENRFPWFRLHPTLAEQAVLIMKDTASTRNTLLYAWCIMPDHAHLLVGDQDLLEFVRLFKGRLTPAARLLAPGRRLWQRSFFDHGLRQAESVESVASYIFENPVRKGLVKSPADYAWSGSEVWPFWRHCYRDLSNGRG